MSLYVLASVVWYWQTYYLSVVKRHIFRNFDTVLRIFWDLVWLKAHVCATLYPRAINVTCVKFQSSHSCCWFHATVDAIPEKITVSGTLQVDLVFVLLCCSRSMSESFSSVAIQARKGEGVTSQRIFLLYKYKWCYDPEDLFTTMTVRVSQSWLEAGRMIKHDLYQRYVTTTVSSAKQSLRSFMCQRHRLARQVWKCVVCKTNKKQTLFKLAWRAVPETCAKE